MCSRLEFRSWSEPYLINGVQLQVEGKDLDWHVDMTTYKERVDITSMEYDSEIFHSMRGKIMSKAWPMY